MIRSRADEEERLPRAARSLEAFGLDRTRPGAAPEARARLCAGLARDGHTEELRELMKQALKERIEPSDMALLLPAAVALDPGSSDSLREVLRAELETLPRSPEAAEAWVREAELA